MARPGKVSDNMAHEVFIVSKTGEFSEVDKWLRSPEAVGKYYYEGFVLSAGICRIYFLTNANTAFALRMKFA